MEQPRGLDFPAKDLAIAAALLALSQVEVWWYGAVGGHLVGAVLLGVIAACLVIRSRHPVISAALVQAGLFACATFAAEPFSATAGASVAIGFFTIGAMENRRLAGIALGVAVLLAFAEVDDLTINNYLAIALSSFVVPWLLGLLWLRRHAEKDAGLRQHQAAERAIADERLRLAHELHDTVSHNVGMIAVQAGAADVLLEKDPARTRESLRAIEDGARETLLELRRLLGLLRDDDPDPLTRAPTLGSLDAFIAPAGDAGVQVELRTDGDPVTLDRAVELTAYRIVQEALTNAVAHAGPCRVTVTVGYAEDRLSVDVTDDGTAEPGTSRGGYGLVGIRERVLALGGSIEAGPLAGGGFRVHALLPLAVR